jgi:hypothetical protein
MTKFLLIRWGGRMLKIPWKESYANKAKMRSLLRYHKYDIANGTIDSGTLINVKLHCPDGSNVEITIDPGHTIYHLKRAVSEKSSISSRHMTIFEEGRDDPLPDNRTMLKLGINSSTNLFLLHSEVVNTFVYSPPKFSTSLIHAIDVENSIIIGRDDDASIYSDPTIHKIVDVKFMIKKNVCGRPRQTCCESICVIRSGPELECVCSRVFNLKPWCSACIIPLTEYQKILDMV